MNKIDEFEVELGYIKDEAVLEDCRTMIELLPDYFFSFPASSYSFPVAQQNQPVFIKVFKKQAKKKEPLSSSKGKILSLYDFSLFF